MQKTAYEMRISDWSSYVCSSDLMRAACLKKVRRRKSCCTAARTVPTTSSAARKVCSTGWRRCIRDFARRSTSPKPPSPKSARSEEHTSELQSLMRISYAVFCLKKKKQKRKLNQE